MHHRFRTAAAALLVVGAMALGFALTGGRARATAAPSGGAAPSAAPDFFYYRRLLEDYLVVTPKGPAYESNFDYTGLFLDPARSERLSRARRVLIEDATPSKMDPRARLAWAINTYNFLVIEAVADHLFPLRLAHGSYMGKRGYVRKAYESVMTIPLPEGSFFESPVAEIEGVSYSISHFERHFVFADFDLTSKQPVPKALDPRAHFAIVNGARGGPPLSPRPYTPDSLNLQLDAACRNALMLPTQLSWDPQAGILRASSLFQWYVADFGGGPKAFAFLKRYAPDSVVTDLQARKLTGITGYIPWNWKLNQADVKHGPGADSTATPAGPGGAAADPDTTR